MDSITGYLKDRGWWFSAFFVAILASVIAGFLKDRIERLFSHFSSRFADWRTKRTAERETLIELLSGNPQLLTLAYIRTVVGLALYLLAVTMFMVLPILYEMRPISSDVFGIDRKFMLSKVLIPLLGGVAIIQGFRAAARLSLVGKAWVRFRSKNQLPKMP